MGRDDLVASEAYQPEPTAAAAARRFVRDTLKKWVATSATADGCGPVDDAVLLASELVTNAVVHAGTHVQVTCRLMGEEVEVMVSDGYPAGRIPEPPDKRQVPPGQTSGRGLLLPAAIASTWGVTYGRTVKAVWFRLRLTAPGEGPDGGRNITRGARLAGLPAPAPGAAVLLGPARGAHGHLPGGDGPGYGELLTSAVESARALVSTDAAYALMADEDGDLSVRASAGAIPPPGAQGPVSDQAMSSLTAPFVVDGRVTGLLAAASAASRRFGDDEAGRLQRLADRWGPQLERARVRELEHLRRSRIGALAQARGLLSGGLTGDEAMALAGRTAVPWLVRWCAVLVCEDAGLRTAYARHVNEALSGALAWLLDRVSDQAGPTAPSPRLPPGCGPAWHWPLAIPLPADAPAGAGDLVSDIAWCFPLGTQACAGVFAVGHPHGSRLPREPAQLVADLACRLGVALTGGPLASHKR